jgi:hypothetical protein
MGERCDIGDRVEGHVVQRTRRIVTRLSGHS